MLARLDSRANTGVLRLDAEGSCVSSPVNHRAEGGALHEPSFPDMTCNVRIGKYPRLHKNLGSVYDYSL